MNLTSAKTTGGNGVRISLFRKFLKWITFPGQTYFVQRSTEKKTPWGSQLQKINHPYTFNEQFVLCKIILVNFSRFQWDKWKNSYQCITVRQRTARYPFVLQSGLFLCTFSIIHCGNLYFFKLHVFHVAPFMLPFFHTAPFPCCTFLCSNVFMLHFFSCCTLFKNCPVSYCTFTRYNVFILHSSPVALFACCTFFQLHFVHFAIFPEVLQESPQTSKMERFAAIITKAIKHCWKVLHLRYSWGSG